MLRSVDREKNGGTAELGVRERFIHRATSTMDFGMENIRKAVNKPNADEIDSEQVQGLIVNFFQEYVQLQQHIAQLNGLLGVDLPKTEEMQRWLESDRQCRTELQKLKAWPQAKKLREIQDSLFASVDRNFERPPIAITKQLPSNAQQQAELDNRTRERDLARIDAEEYKKQLEGVTHQLLTASRTLEAKERALQDALRSKEPGSKIVPQSSVSQPANPRTIQSLSQEERDSLSRDLYNMKSAIPVVYLTESGVEPSSHDRSVFVSIFKKAGIQPGTTGQELEGPDQTGLLLCVPDVKSIPEKVERLAEVLKKYGIETDYAPLVQSKISSTVPPEIGFVLFVGPK